MRLNDAEAAMLAGERGWVRRWALEQQRQVGGFFDAEDFVPVSQVHLMADTESLGESGVALLESMAAAPAEARRVVVPTVTDPRGIDLACYRALRQPDSFAALERRTVEAFRALGILLTNTCINYQIISPPVKGEHLAFGDTGSTIYANSVLGARSNFEGGPAALAAALTGRVPRYGYHLDERRGGTRHFEITDPPRTLSDWGVLGGVVGRRVESYWEVPVLSGIDSSPTSDELKHLGAAAASYGSVAMFHLVGVTPEAPDLQAAFRGPAPAAEAVTSADLQAFYRGFGRHEEKVDVVVFAAPQLSLFETRDVAGLLDGRTVHRDTALLIALAPAVKDEADRAGYTATIEAAGGRVLTGVCFYQMYARELGEANGWTRLLTSSAKLANIIQGYGYVPVLASVDECIDAACAGRMARGRLDG